MAGREVSMGEDTLSALAREAGEIALSASAALRGMLAAQDRPDTKSARDLSAIMKDMAALARDLRGGAAQLRVEFSPEAEEFGG